MEKARTAGAARGPRAPRSVEASRAVSFVNVDVLKFDEHGHYTPGPVCVTGYFEPGDKVKVTVERYE